jgi:hypothetical protein
VATLRKRISDALIDLGFSRRRQAHFKRVDNDFSFCVDTGVIGWSTDIVPYVGIRSDVVERARTELMMLPNDDWVATAGSNVGYVLGGEYRTWQGGSRPQAVLDDILAALESLRPFMGLTTISDVFTRDWAARNPGTPYARVVVALLTDDAPRVARELAYAESIFCIKQDEVCDQFKEFAARVRARLRT